MPHDIFAPSSASTWLKCTYSARRALPEPPKPEKTKAASDEGTRVHGLLEASITEMEFPEDDDSAADAIATGLDFLRQLEPGVTYVEKTVHVTNGCSGKPDLVNLHPYVTTIFDLKNGKWDVDAYHNDQMLTYGGGYVQQVQSPWFRFVIYQPNGLDEMPFKQWVAHRTQVEAHLQRVVAAVNDPNPTPKPGPHCRWCKAFAGCEAMANDTAFVMAAVARPIETLTEADIVRLLRLVRGLGDLKGAYEEALTVRYKLGRPVVDGSGMKPKKSFRAWNDNVQAATFLHGKYGPKGIKPISPAQAEKLGPEAKAYAAVAVHKPPGDMAAFY